MKDTHHLSATESEIMEKLWEIGEPIRQTQLLELFNAGGKNWSRQTLNTLLIRLERRGFIHRERRIVSAQLKKTEFGLDIIKEVIEKYLSGDKELVKKAIEG